METAFSVDVKKDKEQTKILFAGELIINNIEKIKTSVAESVDFSNNLSVNITNPSGIDITFIQLICSLKNTCKSKNIEFAIEGNFSEEAYTLLSNAGFNDLFKL